MALTTTQAKTAATFIEDNTHNWTIDPTASDIRPLLGLDTGIDTLIQAAGLQLCHRISDGADIKTTVEAHRLAVQLNAIVLRMKTLWTSYSVNRVTDLDADPDSLVCAAMLRLGHVLGHDTGLSQEERDTYNTALMDLADLLADVTDSTQAALN